MLLAAVFVPDAVELGSLEVDSTVADAEVLEVSVDVSEALVDDTGADVDDTGADEDDPPPAATAAQSV